MLTNKTLSLLGAVALVVAASSARAETYSDTGAAVLIWPKIVTNETTDTLLQITNQANAATFAHCFYVNANSRCSNTGLTCESSAECQEGAFFGACLPAWIEVNFDIFLTPLQPLAWAASEGLSGSATPCPGGLGATCSGNQGTSIPPVGEENFIGELKCIQADPIDREPFQCAAANCRNDLQGSATITSVDGTINPQRYNAVGLRTGGGNDGDNVLVIGGPDPEYQACASVLVFDHLFDGAIDPVTGDAAARSELTLVPCTQDFLIQQIPTVTAQFLVYNEFEQRFSTSRQVRCQLDSQISLIDTTQPERSIFSASVAGTVAGQTRITGVNGGLVGSALLNFDSETVPTSGSGYNLNQSGNRVLADFIRIP